MRAHFVDAACCVEGEGSGGIVLLLLSCCRFCLIFGALRIRLTNYFHLVCCFYGSFSVLRLLIRAPSFILAGV